MVLAHELAHIQRHDIAWHWLNRLACALAWFNPLIWFASRKSVLERERACDDRVIEFGFKATDYSRSLVDVAAMMSGKASLTAAVSMAEPPLKQRLRSILASDHDEERDSTWFQFLAVAIVLTIALSIGIFRPLATASASLHPSPEMSVPSIQDGAADSTATKAAESKQPELISGKIIDESGQPISGAIVNIYVREFRPGGMYIARELAKFMTVSDEQGEYQFDISKVPAHKEPLYLWVTAAYDQCWKRQKGIRESAFQENNKLPSIQLRKGRSVRGKIVPPDGMQTLQNTKVSFRALTLDRIEGTTTYMDNFWHLIEVDENGEFQCWVPKGSNLSIAATAGGCAVSRAELDSGENNFGEIKLSKGTIVRGFLQNQQSKPIPNVVVRLVENEWCFIDNTAYSISSSALTDDQGKFEFPPHRGKCTVLVETSGGSTFGADLYPDIERQPIVTPVIVNLGPDGSTKGLLLKQAEPIWIGGKVVFEDGLPAAGVLVTTSARAGNASFYPTQTLTDETGLYRIAIHPEAASFGILVNGKRNGQGEMIFGWPNPHKQSKRSSMQSIIFENIEGDISNVDWTLKPRAKKELPEITPPNISPPKSDSVTPAADEENGRKEFSRLQEMYKEYWEKLQVAEKNADSPAEAQLAYMKLDPRNAMAEHYLAFEEKYRGQEVAFLAINAAMSSAVSVGNPETNVAKGRNQMLKRVIEHYLKHEKLAEVFDHLDGGPAVPDRDKVLDMAARVSPNPNVRGTAILHQAYFAMKDIREAEMLPDFRAFVTDNQDGYSEALLREVRDRLDFLESIDLEKHRDKALTYLDVVENQYANVPCKGRFYPGNLSDAARRLRYSLSNVIVGEPVPNLSFVDINGQPIRLKKLRGRPVVLTFCFGHHEKLAGQNLAEKYADKDISFVSLVGFSNRESFNAKFPRDTLRGAIAAEKFSDSVTFRNWMINSNTTFLIDADGILRTNGSDSMFTEKWIEANVK